MLSSYAESGSLNVSQRRQVIKLAAEWMIQRFGNKISIDNKIAVAKAIVELFPALQSKGKNIQSYVSFELNIQFGLFVTNTLFLYSTQFTIQQLADFWVRNSKT